MNTFSSVDGKKWTQIVLRSWRSFVHTLQGDLVELLLDYHTTVAMAAAKALIALGAAGAEALMQRHAFQ